MTEHEKLKEICDIIWYDILLCGSSFWWYTKEQNEKLYRHAYYNTTYNEFHRNICWNKSMECNVREIIFTQEFMDKFRDYRPLANIWCILNNLDKPVDYLYNILTK